MSEQQPSPKFITYRAFGEGVPGIVQPRMYHDSNKQWAYGIPVDVQQYLKSQLGEDVIVTVPEVPAVSSGYCRYNATRDGEVVGGISLGGDYTKPGSQSAWFLFKKEE